MIPAPTAEVLPTHTPELFEAAVVRAVSLLQSGGLVALPTETVYGLAANAQDAAAVARIFAVKGRPAANPVIVHVASLELARRCARSWPEIAGRFARAFWPGPLTMVLPRSSIIPDIVTAGGDTVAIRWPSHPFIQSVIHGCGFPLAAPSANRSTEVSPTNAQHVVKSLGAQLPLIVDGGQSQVGIESTVIDLSTTRPRVLRPGMIHVESLLAVTGDLSWADSDPAAPGVLRSPGLLPKHYAPRATLKILNWRDEADLRNQLAALGLAPAETHLIAHRFIPAAPDFRGVSVVPHDAEAFARALYSELHRCDDEGASIIVVEALPDSVEWHAIADRLRRAATR